MTREIVQGVWDDNELSARMIDYLLEHIISGAMAAGIPARATRRAFARDKADGVIRGVTVADVVQAVNDVFFENKDLDHAFAFEEFRQAYIKEAQEQDK